MINPVDDIPVSPMKKLKILGEKQQNEIKLKQPLLEQIKENEGLKRSDSVDSTMSTRELEVEPLLKESIDQYVIFPISYDDIWQMYKEFVGNFWAPSETINSLTSTLDLDYNEAKFFKLFCTFFASPDSKGHVVENFTEEFSKVVQVTEAKFFYGHQLFIQNIHYEVYNNLFDKLTDTAEREKLHKLVESNYSVINVRNWLKLWMRDSASFANQLVVSACLHGILFTSLDVVINWLEERIEKQKAQKIDKELHDMFVNMRFEQKLMSDFASVMIGKLIRKPTVEFVNETIFQAAKLELDFLLNGLHVEDYLSFSSNDLLMLIDKRTKEIKSRIFMAIRPVASSASETQLANKMEQSNENENVGVENVSEETKPNKDSYQKITFDEDF